MILLKGRDKIETYLDFDNSARLNATNGLRRLVVGQPSKPEASMTGADVGPSFKSQAVRFARPESPEPPKSFRPSAWDVAPYTNSPKDYRTPNYFRLRAGSTRGNIPTLNPESREGTVGHANLAREGSSLRAFRV